MKTSKCLLICLLLITTKLLLGQSTIGLYGGYNYSKIYDKNGGNFPSYQNYNTLLFGFDYKEKKDKLINFGFTLNYNTQSFHMESDFAHKIGFSHRNTHFDLGIVAFDIYPELCIGKIIKFYGTIPLLTK